jgi:glycerol uptake facilitator-like aquaporin
MEFMSTMLFVVIGVGSVLSGGELDHSFTPARLLVVGTAFGYAIVVLAYSSAAISGAHFNPAVTFALVITRKIGVIRGIFYFAAQVVGGICGAFLIRAAIPQAAQGEGVCASVDGESVSPPSPLSYRVASWCNQDHHRCGGA